MSAPRPLPPQEYLLRRLAYDPASGELRWRPRPESDFSALSYQKMWNARFAGKVAGTPTCGAISCVIDGASYLAHRVIWKMVNGTEPAEIDHIRGGRANNRLDNLRPADRVINMRNTKRRSDNRSGVVGVAWDRARRKWVAFIHDDGRSVHLGRFALLDDAVAARRGAEIRLDYHPNHGRTAEAA